MRSHPPTRAVASANSSTADVLRARRLPRPHAALPPRDAAGRWSSPRARWSSGSGELGFADHNPMPAHFDDWRMLREDLPRYLEEVEKARAQFPQLTIRLGLECDFLAGREAWIEELRGLAEWDFFIGSVHYLPDGAEVDNPKYHQPLPRRQRGGNLGELLADLRAASAAGSSISSRIPTCRRSSATVRRATCGASTSRPSPRSRRRGTPFEINTAGWRKECREQYPAREFLELAHAAQRAAAHQFRRARGGGTRRGFRRSRRAGEGRRLHADRALSPAADFFRRRCHEARRPRARARMAAPAAHHGHRESCPRIPFPATALADVDAALENARGLVADGADIIDIGAESARTNRAPISEEEEAAQLRRASSSAGPPSCVIVTRHLPAALDQYLASRRRPRGAARAAGTF